LAVSASRTAFPPLLPVGIHRTDLAGLQRLCVDYFPGSRTRPRLMNAVSMVAALASRLGIISRIWVAGSLLTEDENPGDCTLILVLTEEVLRALDEEQREFVDWFRDVSLHDKYGCNNYAIVLDVERPEYERLNRFWLRQLGFHAPGRSGVAELLTPTSAP
jgi:hypothetical protein